MLALCHFHKMPFIYYGDGILFVAYVATSDAFVVKQNCSLNFMYLSYYILPCQCG